MNAVFYIIAGLCLTGLWLAMSSSFDKIGTLFQELIERAKDAMDEEDKEDDEDE